jgi:hypothetical protein
MRTMNQHSHTTSRFAPCLLALLGAFGAACTNEEEPEPGLLVIDRDFFDFGQLMVGQTSTERVFTIRNAGPDALDGLDVRLESNDTFLLVGTTCVGWLEASETCTATVAFAPGQAGAVRGDLVVDAYHAEARVHLAGTGAALLRMTNTAAGNPLVVSEPAGIRCGSVCEAIFTVPEVVLSVPDGGFATWSGPCETTAGGSCLLRLQGETSVALLDFASAVQWIFNGIDPLNSLLIDAQNNVIGASGGAPRLFKLSPAGEVLWQIYDLEPGVTAAVDSQGNIALASVTSVWKIDGSGDVQWSMDLANLVTEIQNVAFDPAGNLYVAGVQRSSTESIVHLAKYDGSGIPLWSGTYAPTAMSAVMDLVVDGDGEAIISGFGNADPSEGLTVQFLRKYDEDGNVLWTNENTGIFGYELAVDGWGNIFVAERMAGGLPGSYILHKYTAEGGLLWETHAEDIGGLVSGLAVTDAGDVIAIGTRYGEGEKAVGVWAAKFEGIDGTRRRPIEIQFQGERQFARDVAVDGNGDVILAGGEDDPWLRKYDGAVFDQPAE